jgi:hypothetical protein
LCSSPGCQEVATAEKAAIEKPAIEEPAIEKPALEKPAIEKAASEKAAKDPKIHRVSSIHISDELRRAGTVIADVWRKKMRLKSPPQSSG